MGYILLHSGGVWLQTFNFTLFYDKLSSIETDLKKAQIPMFWKRQFVHFAPFNAAVTPFGSKKWLFSG